MSLTQAVTEETGGEVIAIVGKTAKCSDDLQDNAIPLHIVSAWACQNRLVLRQETTQEKSNELALASDPQP